MKVLTNIQTVMWDKSAVAMGKFEGLHIGHRKLIDKIIEKQQDGMVPVAFTFDVSPRIFFGRGEGVLFTSNERRQVFDSWNVKYLVEYPFDRELAMMEAENFIEEILCKKLKASYIVVGKDFRFGYNRRGNVEMLRKYAEKGFFELEVVEKVEDEKYPISSTRVREELEQGNIEIVNKMLDFDFFLEGTVVSGNQMGRTWGFPTANIMVNQWKLLPPNGVYYSQVSIDEKKYYGITNIGIKPTVADGMQKGAETFLYNFNGDLYGKNIKVQLKHFVRAEQAFESVETLIERIRTDVNNGEKYFGLEQ